MTLHDIKSMIEKLFKTTLYYDLKVEFVANVIERAEEIATLDDIKWSNAYESDHYWGIFMPDTPQHSAYILVQSEGRQFGAILETCFHEEKHAIDYIQFLRNIFDGDKEKMIHSPLYATFQIYSEFEAKKFGLLQYLNVIQNKGVTNLEEATVIIANAKQNYNDIRNIKNKYQFLMHSVQYLGCLLAVNERDSSYIDLNTELSQMLYIENLVEIFIMLDSREKDKDWFEKFDQICREYVG